MKKISMVMAAVVALVFAVTAFAFDDATRSIYKLSVAEIDNPDGATVTVNDSLTVNGTLAGTITNFTGNGANVTNISGANIVVSVNPGFSGVITNGIGLAYTNRFCFYNGFVTNVYITGP